MKTWGIPVSLVVPGAVDTPIFATDARVFSAFAHVPSRLRERLVMSQLGLPGDR